MIGFDLDPVAVELEAPSVVFGRGLVSADPGVWTLLLTQRDGTIDETFTGDLKGVVVTEREDLPAQMTISRPVSGDPLSIVEREVQLYDGSDIVFHGPLLQRSADSKDAFDPYTAYGLEWYLSRRFYDSGSVARIQVPLRENEGRIDMNGTTFFLDIECTVNMHSSYVSDYHPFLEAWVDNYEIGVGIIDVVDELGYTYGQAMIDPREFPRDRDITVRVTLLVKLRDIILIHAEFANGGIPSDELTVGPVTAWISGVGSYADAPIPTLLVSDLVRRSVSGLNLGYRQIGAGVPTVVVPPPSQHVDETLNQGNASDLWKWGVVSTGATRTVTVWTHDHPRGKIWDEDDLHLWTDGRHGTIRRYALSDDGTKARSRLVLKNEQDARGSAIAPGAWGDLVLEDEQSAPPGTRNELLQLTAYNLLRKDLGAIRNVQIVVAASLRSTLNLYDKVQVDIDHGTRQVHGRHRVVGRTITPGAPFMGLELTKDED